MFKANAGRYYRKTLFLALVVVFAVCAVAASAASAASPEFKPVPTKKKFTSTGGAFKLEHPFGQFSCTKSTMAGEITGAGSVGHAVMTLTGCKVEEDSKTCEENSVGAKKGEIVTNALKGELGTVETTEAASGVGLLLQPEAARGVWTTVAESSCLAESALEGELAGEVVTTGKKQLTNELSFGVSGSGSQKIRNITVASKEKEPDLHGWGFAELTVESSDALTFEEALEVT